MKAPDPVNPRTFSRLPITSTVANVSIVSCAANTPTARAEVRENIQIFFVTCMPRFYLMRMERKTFWHTFLLQKANENSVFERRALVSELKIKRDGLTHANGLSQTVFRREKAVTPGSTHR